MFRQSALVIAALLATSSAVKLRPIDTSFFATGVTNEEVMAIKLPEELAQKGKANPPCDGSNSWDCHPAAVPPSLGQKANPPCDGSNSWDCHPAAVPPSLAQQ